MTRTDDLLTNRDLYLFVARLRETHAGCQRSLEDYLAALWHRGRAERAHGALPLPRFAALLAAALRDDAPGFDPAWSRDYRLDADGVAGHARWERTVRRQIVDLHEMAAAGILDDDQRYFGVDAPRGPRWYNFDPLTFLECAVAGTFDGWQAGDPTGRDHVPGLVAVLDESGHVTAADPKELDPPVAALGPIAWDTFAAFLDAGQSYE